ncbi:MAG: hypothetical protein MZV70_39475 [Desulfobacterales bacterium]|nr:hypothetical protein [Desulfobacterales bacterium]
MCFWTGRSRRRLATTPGHQSRQRFGSNHRRMDIAERIRMSGLPTDPEMRSNGSFAGAPGRTAWCRISKREAPMDWKGFGRAWLAGLAACAALGFAVEAAADGQGGHGQFVVFGDSLSDPGNAFVLLRETEVAPFELIPDAPYARGGLHFSNGETWVEQLRRPARGATRRRTGAGEAAGVLQLCGWRCAGAGGRSF